MCTNCHVMPSLIKFANRSLELATALLLRNCFSQALATLTPFQFGLSQKSNCQKRSLVHTVGLLAVIGCRTMTLCSSYCRPVDIIRTTRPTTAFSTLYPSWRVRNLRQKSCVDSRTSLTIDLFATTSPNEPVELRANSCQSLRATIFCWRHWQQRS